MRELLKEWFANHAGGLYAITQDGQPLTKDQATGHLNRTLRGGEKPHTKWSKIKGFHAFSHSVASILVSKGVGQRYIDKLLGHQTEEMRARYQHLFPKCIKAAINLLMG